MSTAVAAGPLPMWGLVEGDRLTDDLTAVRLLGGGNAYEAWLAFDEITFAPVVVKLLRPDQVDDASALRGIRREIRALAELNHPVLVRALRHDLDGPRPHLVLEQVDGPRLSTLVRRHGPLQAQQYLPLAIDLASALHYLRHVGYVHLDLKPSNIIMGAPARLIDLSVARTVDEAAALDHPIGTDAYMAPEQCEPGTRGAPGPASDVWGLAATLFEAITGERPFARAEDRRFGQLDTRPGALPDGVPLPVADVVYAGLAVDPSHRPAPSAIAEALEPVLAALPRGRLSGFRPR